MYKYPRASVGAIVLPLSYFSALLVCHALCASNFVSRGWVPVANTTTSPLPLRGEFSMSRWQSSLLLYGGCDIGFRVFYNDLWQASFSKNVYSWTKVTTSGEQPAPSCGHGAVILKDRMYILGGLVSPNVAYGNGLHALNLITMKWSRINTPINLAQRSLIQHAMVALPNHPGFYVAPGMRNEGVNNSTEYQSSDDSAYLFSVETSTWSKVSKESKDIAGVSAVTINDTLFVLGGYQNHAASNAFVFLANGTFHNISITNRGASKTSLGPIAFQGALAINNDFMVVYGGFSDFSINPFLWVFIWDDFPNQGRWCKISTSIMPPPHFAAGFNIVGDFLYAYGGRVHPHGHYEELSADMWRYDGIVQDFEECKRRLI